METWALHVCLSQQQLILENVIIPFWNAQNKII